MANVFSVEIFFIVFRECLEASVIISVLLAFIKQGLGKNLAGDDEVANKRLYRKLVKEVWIGAFLGLFICLCIGGAFIGVFYSLGKDIWANSEDLWEGVFSIIATIMITIMGLAMLRINKMKEKWRVKIARAILDSTNSTTKKKFSLSRLGKRYAMALLPFVTTLREGVEAIVFVGGVSLGTPATAFPLAVIAGLAAGIGVGLFLYYGGNQLHMQWFLIASTCFLYLICAGLWSRAIWYFEMNLFSKQAGGDVAEQGSGPGSYNVQKSVWHVNCCNPETDNGWEIFNALFGWQNSATYGSVISYNIYWLFIVAVVLSLLYEERTGHLPFMAWTKNSKLFARFSKKKMSQEEADNVVREAEQAAAHHYGGNRAIGNAGTAATETVTNGGSSTTSDPEVDPKTIEKTTELNSTIV